MTKPYEQAFDELFPLKDDPEAFAKKRLEIIEEFINSQPPEKRDNCRRRQWRIDQEMHKFKDQTAKYNRIVAMFWEQLAEFQRGLNLLTKAEPVEEPIESADVLVFEKPDS